MDDVKDFELGTILTMTTGNVFVDNFIKVFELAWFVFNDNFINTIGLDTVKNNIKEHLFTIYPELRNVKYRKGVNPDKFLEEQEKIFGSYLPVTRLGQKLSERKRSK